MAERSFRTRASPGMPEDEVFGKSLVIAPSAGEVTIKRRLCANGRMIELTPVVNEKLPVLAQSDQL